ncbi:MAG: hypothetical protein WDN28_24835 [Chthoniobacter sp.]
MAADLKELSFAPPRDLRRADIYTLEVARSPKAVLILCPGCNGNGQALVSQPIWQQFATDHQMGLIGISFASDEGLFPLGRGYYYASKGSGDVLLTAVRQIYGRDLPLALYGFSGGAQFVSRFVEWHPDRVLTWCAYSAGWWDKPVRSNPSPPGIVACGEDDSSRFGASLSYFLQGRAAGKPWTWVSVARTDHRYSESLDAFVRVYFACCLQRGLTPNYVPDLGRHWFDNDLKKPVDAATAQARPCLFSWLPDETVAAKWSTFEMQ